MSEESDKDITELTDLSKRLASSFFRALVIKSSHQFFYLLIYLIIAKWCEL